MFGRACRWDIFVGPQPPTAGEKDRFPAYIKAVEERLRRHGFTRTFELDKDPARQDRLRTWIEYLAHEYWWYDIEAPSKRQQRRYNDAWGKLVGSEVLTPFDTQESVCSVESGFAEQHKEKEAKKAVESAESAVNLAQKTLSNPRRIDHCPKELLQRLRQAQSQLDTVTKEYNLIKRRHDLIFEFSGRTKNYRIAADKAKRQSTLLEWILQQIPLIEHELKQSDTINGSDGTDDKQPF
ncbi:hypothetical protein AJ80_08866 [Polytolypa hystricis UAMH7299]|uniref:Uncharacterized protein n=1 Tax=Polytolypa hystricis (strain UAMH7299) TaxID=1447883 RepID=A0A2B7WSI0_POLH7|nr:hypothetical protein AJ80_08866 [Polytolypa hystricis UAMH7299]